MNQRQIEELRAQGLPIWRIAVILDRPLWQVWREVSASKRRRMPRMTQREAIAQSLVDQAEPDAECDVERDMEAMRWL